MAFVNPNKPAGLSPIKYLNGANYDGKGQLYSILAATTNPIYVGDLVDLAAGGDSLGIPAIALATAGSLFHVGVVVAIGTVPQGGPYVNVANMGSTTYRPTGAQTQNYYALVADDPNIIFEIQEGGTGTNIAATNFQGNSNIIYAAPATGVFMSGTQLDNTALPTTTATKDLKVLRLVQRIDNHFVTSPATGGGAQKWEVLINNHQFASRPAAI